MPRVLVQNGPNKGLVYEIGNHPITIGRDPASTIQILDRGASRHHAEIFQIGEMCFIRDLGSRNGTYVGDEKVTEDLLREGDVVQIGSTFISFDAGAAGTGRQIDVNAADPAEDQDPTVTGTLELRLDDLAGFESDEEEPETNRLKAMLEITKLISSEQDENSLMNTIVEYLSSLVLADNVYVFLRDEQNNNLNPRARFEKAPDVSGKISKGIIRRSMKEGRALLSSDAMADARFKQRESIIMNLIRSVICVPLLGRERVLGVVYLTSNRLDHAFSEEDLELVSAVATQVALGLDTINFRRRQRETYLSALRTLIALIDIRDPETSGHGERVCSYAAAICQQMGLPEKDWTSVQLVALLHDIGKLALETIGSQDDEFHLPREAVKPESGESGPILTAGRTLRDHPDLGAEIAGNIVGGEDVAQGIRHHHELWNGEGYPTGLKEEDIPLTARIVAVADRLDHLTTLGGEHSEGMSMKGALMALDREAGKDFDPQVVRALHIAYRNGSLFSPRTIFGAAGQTTHRPPTATSLAGDGLGSKG